VPWWATEHSGAVCGRSIEGILSDVGQKWGEPNASFSEVRRVCDETGAGEGLIPGDGPQNELGDAVGLMESEYVGQRRLEIIHGAVIV
jgi:hypothetical protein